MLGVKRRAPSSGVAGTEMLSTARPLPTQGIARFRGPHRTPAAASRSAARPLLPLRRRQPHAPPCRHALEERRLRSAGRAHAAAAQPPASPEPSGGDDAEGPSTDLAVIYARFVKLALPFWTKERNADSAREAQLMLAGVFVLTLGCTGVSVLFNFLGRDFYNALAEKNADGFWHQMQIYLVAIPCGIPVYVFRDFATSKLQLKWRRWMTRELTGKYLSEDKTYYALQRASTSTAGGPGAGAVVDNPDQRLSADVNAFTDTALGFTFTIVNSVVDLVSFSNILYTIYPPLFAVLVVYALGGTFLSVQIGKPLVEIQFQQEKREADFRYSLVRIRDNAESIAFFGGERREVETIDARLGLALDNLLRGIRKSRDLAFFQSFYKYIIQLLPAAVIAPLFFRGEIEFGVINQSASAFNHILHDVSLVVYQFEALAGFSAIIDRLGQFVEAIEANAPDQTHAASQSLPPPAAGETSAAAAEKLGSPSPSHAQANGVNGANGANGAVVGAREARGITTAVRPRGAEPGDDAVVLRVEGLEVQTPDGGTQLTSDLNLEVAEGDSVLVLGRSGVGKTSFLRALAGLWRTGRGRITTFGAASEVGPGAEAGKSTQAGKLREIGRGKEGDGEGSTHHDVFFLPQRPYMILGTLRDQLLYPGSGASQEGGRTDAFLMDTLEEVRLGDLLARCAVGASGEDVACGLDADLDWSALLSLGEQQRLAFARLIVAAPRLAILDEATSALDVETEAHLYRTLKAKGVTYISVGHRPTLLDYHDSVLKMKRGEDGFSAKVIKASEVNDVQQLML